MYGSIFRMNVKPGYEKQILELMDEWERDVRPGVSGARGGYVMKPDGTDDVLVGVAVFSDRDTYRANAESPEQDAWYQKLRALLTDDPSWEDGEFVGSWD